MSVPVGISPPALRKTDAGDVPERSTWDTANSPCCAAASSISTFESAAAICSAVQPALYFRESDIPAPSSAESPKSAPRPMSARGSRREPPRMVAAPRKRPGRRSRDIRRRCSGSRNFTVVALYPARHHQPDPQAAREGRWHRLRRRHPRWPAGYRGIAAGQAHHRARPQQAALRRQRPAPPPARPRTRRPAVGTDPIR